MKYTFQFFQATCSGYNYCNESDVAPAPRPTQNITMFMCLVIQISMFSGDPGHGCRYWSAVHLFNGNLYMQQDNEGFHMYILNIISLCVNFSTIPVQQNGSSNLLFQKSSIKQRKTVFLSTDRMHSQNVCNSNHNSRAYNDQGADIDVCGRDAKSNSI